MRWRLLLLGTGALLGCLGLLASGPARAEREAFVPSSDEQVLERLPERLGSRPPRAPVTDAAEAERLAREDIQRYQASSDPRFLGHAEARLATFWNASGAPTGIVVLRAKVRASNHEFERALLDLDQVLEREPAHAQALFERATIAAVLGRYDAARADCQRLTPLVPELSASGCRAVVSGATGHAAEAAVELQAVLARARGISDAEASWAESLLGELAARTGDLQAGEAWFRRALARSPEDAYTVGALSDLLIDTQRTAEVISLLAKLERIDGLLLRLAIAEAELGRPGAGAHVEQLGERFAAARLRGSDVHRREEARFELVLRKNAPRALELSLANFAVQRELWDVRLVLEAALAAGKPEAAREAISMVKKSGLEDPHVQKLVLQLERLER